MTTTLRSVIVDACVLIDVVSSDGASIRLVSRAIGRVHVASLTLDLVEGLDVEAARALHLQVVEPTLEVLASAAGTKGGLSLRDRVCLLLAKANGWACITDDECMRRECEAVGVEVISRLEAVMMLVEAA